MVRAPREKKPSWSFPPPRASVVTGNDKPPGDSLGTKLRHPLQNILPKITDATAINSVEELDEALAQHGKLESFNTDQGSQFTSFAFTGRL